MGSPTCPYCMQRADRCACEDPRIVGYENATPTPPGAAPDAASGPVAPPRMPAPADDATRHESASAEAMREACAKACRKVANGTRRPSGQSPSTLSRLSAIAEGAYLCEKAIRALPLPAPASGAVEETRPAFLSMLFEPKWDGTIGRAPTWHLRGDFRHVLAGMRGETLDDAIRALPLPPATGDATRVPARPTTAADAVVEAARDLLTELDRDESHFIIPGQRTRASIDALRAALRREKGGA